MSSSSVGEARGVVGGTRRGSVAPAAAGEVDGTIGPEDILTVNPGKLYTEPTPEFYLEMKRRIDSWFRERNLTRFAPPRQLWKGWICFTIAVISYALILTQMVPRWAMLPMCLLSGMTMFIFAMSFAHDSCHNAMSPNPRWNALWAYAYDIAGVSSYITNTDHMSGHHRAPNVSGIDVAVGSDVEPTFRLHPDVPLHWWQRAQHLYFPIAYALSTLHKWFILDYTGILGNRFGLRSGRRGALKKITIALAFKVFTMFWAIGLPIMILHVRWWEIVLGLLAFHTLPGLLVGLTFQLTHISDINDFPSLAPDGKLHTSRALHTLRTNLDIMPESRLLNAFTCGLMSHVSHHLFPEIAHEYLPDIAPIIERTAQEYGVPYKKHPTLKSALLGHYRILRFFSRDTPDQHRAYA
ncbi:MAG: linoleoyl-CoA desaturase [Thermoanaerobaculia bacterium]|nr:linoleoyl-CoA desaturase [Thermoanaerobaculia bacterium]